MATKPIVSLWTRLLDVVSPRACSVCGQRLTPTEQVVCGCCLIHLPYTLFEHDAYENPMARLFWGLLPIEKAVAMFYYEPRSEVSALIYDMKYHDHSEVGRHLGQLIAQQLMPTGFFDDVDGIVPVPLTRRRHRQRGYNQSMEIARGVSQLTGLPIFDKVVSRQHFTESQTHLGVNERRENVKDAFRLEDAATIEGCHLLLVDDIVTTGATCAACGQALAQATGVRLSILSLGYTKS